MVVQKQATLAASIIFIVRFAGLWETGKKCRKKFIVMIMVFCYLSSFILQTIGLVLYKNNLELEFEIFSVISFSGMGILKLQSLHRNRNLWLGLLDRMKDLEKIQMNGNDSSAVDEYESDNNSKRIHGVNIVKDYTKKYNRAVSILRKIYRFTGIIFILSPFIEYAFGLLNGKKPEYPHVLPSWNPFDKIHFICYISVIIIEIVAAIYSVAIHTAFDAAVIGIMIFICGQFSFLVYQSTRIGGMGKLYYLSKKRDARAHARIIKCHKVQLQLVRCIDELDKLLKNILGFYFFLATLTLCTVAVRFKTEQMGAMQLVSLFQYMCSSLTQLYIYCSYGDAVCNESSISASQGPFGAAIWCLSPKIRKEICILGMCMMKQRRLHAGPFNTVDLPSFIQIVRAAYSCYAVLGDNKIENNMST